METGKREKKCIAQKGNSNEEGSETLNINYKTFPRTCKERERKRKLERCRKTKTRKKAEQESKEHQRKRKKNHKKKIIAQDKRKSNK